MEKENKSTDHIELSSDTQKRISPIQALSAEFASRDAEWHQQKTRQLLWNVDLHLLPWIVLMYLTNFLDRKYLFRMNASFMSNNWTDVNNSALSQARLGSLEKDLGLKGTEFNTITSILFIVCILHCFILFKEVNVSIQGYILFQLPSNLLLTRVRPSLYLCGMMALWYFQPLVSTTFSFLTHVSLGEQSQPCNLPPGILQGKLCVDYS